MHWVYKRGYRKHDLIEERTRTRTETDDQGVTLTTRCLAHCYQGSVFTGVVWSVWERSYENNGEQIKPPQRWIGCDLLHYENGFGWGYKFLNEVSHPDYCSCPLAYLDLVPIEVYGGHQAWRDGVRRFHARRSNG